MLVKRMSFDSDVLDILRGMDWKNEGRLGVITAKLARDLYVRTNKALEAMGGKWSRKEGGHVFALDPRDQVEGLLNSGVLEVEKDGFFETPRDVVLRMLDLAPLRRYHTILEPSAGLGAIAEVLLECGATRLKLIEKNEMRVAELRKKFKDVECGDFMFYFAIGFDRIYMNPPFEQFQDVKHVMHAYPMLREGGKLVAVMSEGAFFRQDKKAVEFCEWLSEVKGTSEKLPAGSFKSSGTGVNARLVVISR